MQPILEVILNPKQLPENIAWASLALTITGLVIALFHSALLTTLFLLIGAGCLFVAYAFHMAPDLSTHVSILTLRLQDMKSHIDSIKGERNKLKAEIKHLMTVGSRIQRATVRLKDLTEALSLKEAEFAHLLLRYEATAAALNRVEQRLDMGVTRLHNEVNSLASLAFPYYAPQAV
jgi:hypothetical protein